MKEKLMICINHLMVKANLPWMIGCWFEKGYPICINYRWGCLWIHWMRVFHTFFIHFHGQHTGWWLSHHSFRVNSIHRTTKSSMIRIPTLQLCIALLHELQLLHLQLLLPRLNLLSLVSMRTKKYKNKNKEWTCFVHFFYYKNHQSKSNDIMQTPQCKQRQARNASHLS